MSFYNKELNMSSQLRESMDTLLNCGVINRHSYFQLKYFVVGKEPTIQSKMWRCIRELSARRDSLNAMDLELVDTKENIELVEIEIARLKGTKFDPAAEEWVRDLGRKEIDIRIKKKERQKLALEESLANLNKKQKETEEEATFFIKSFEALQRIEPLKPFDDVQEQTKYWNEKLTQLINLKVLLHLPLDTELVQTILSLSDDCGVKTEMVKLLNQQANIKSIENQGK